MKKKYCLLIAVTNCIVIISLAGYNIHPTGVNLATNNSLESLASVNTQTYQALTTSFFTDISPEQVRNDFVPNIPDSVMKTLLSAFDSVPKEHRKRLMNAIIPAIYVLCDPEVVNVVGGIVSIETKWKKISQKYTPLGSMPGENFDCSVKLKNLNKDILRGWWTNFPGVTNDFAFLPANINGADLLEPVFERLSQPLLSKIATENKASNVRSTAVSYLTDQSLLVKIAMEDNNSNVRRKAVNKLDDQSVLTKIALEDKDSIVRYRAVDKLTDQTMLVRIALEDKSRQVRITAVDKLNDQSVLTKIALEDNDWYVRRTIVYRLNDQAVLTKIALNDKNPDVRRSTVDKLTDQALLTKIALEDIDKYVRNAAANKLSDQSVLAKIASEDKDWYVRWGVVMRLDNESLLEKIAVKDENSTVRLEAKERLEKLRKSEKK